MSDRIPANAKKYIKQVRANRQKQKQKQSNKQTTTVIINPESKRRRAPNKPKSAPSSGGGGAPNVIPYVIPQTQLTAASYQNSAVQPPDAIQQLTQALGQFQQNQNQIYRNPLRMAPFRAAMNPAPIQQVEEPLPEPIQELPNPVMPDIVQEQNFVEQLARPPMAVPINQDSPVVQGFAVNQAQNDLARQQDMGLNAYEDFGGYDAQSPSQETYEVELGRQRKKLNVFMGGGGGMGSYDEIPLPSTPPESTLIKKSGKGRPFTEVTPFQQHGIELYIMAREKGLKGDRKFLSSLSVQDKDAYDAGRLLVTAKNRNNNPYVAEYIRIIEDRYE